MMYTDAVIQQRNEREVRAHFPLQEFLDMPYVIVLLLPRTLLLREYPSYAPAMSGLADQDDHSASIWQEIGGRGGELPPRVGHV